MKKYFPFKEQNDDKIYILPNVHYQYHIKYGLFEKQLMKYLENYIRCNCDKNGTFLDIGAHTGTYTIYFKDYFKNIYSFEPNPEVYGALEGSIALNKRINDETNIKAYNFGLGSPLQKGIQTLYIDSIDGGSASLIKMKKVQQSYQVEIKTLDELNIENVTFIKLDIEGNEMNFFLGAINTLKRCSSLIIFEQNNGIGEQEQKFLSELGYEIKYIEGINNMFFAVPIIVKSSQPE